MSPLFTVYREYGLLTKHTARDNRRGDNLCLNDASAALCSIENRKASSRLRLYSHLSGEDPPLHLVHFFGFGHMRAAMEAAAQTAMNCKARPARRHPSSVKHSGAEGSGAMQDTVLVADRLPVSPMKYHVGSVRPSRRCQWAS